MNKNFADWYRYACIEPNDEMLRKRWDGIVAFLEEIEDVADIIELIKLFFYSHCKNEFRDKFTRAFQDIDSAFSQKSDNEISVLAGVALIRIIEEYNWDEITMLAVKSIAFNNKVPVVADIFEEILNKFEFASSEIRENIFDVKVSQIDIPSSSSLIDKLKQVQQTNNWDAVEISKQLIGYITKVDKSLNVITNSKKENQRMLKILFEDSQILWWMTSGWSNDFDKPFKDIKIEETSIILGKELGDIIQIVPGPFSAKAVLHTVLYNHSNQDILTEIALSDAVDALDNRWKMKIVEGYNVDLMKEITPVLFAISKSLEVDGAGEWLPVFKKQIGYSADDKKIKPIDLAYQVYLECLLFKCYSEFVGE